MLFWLLFFNSMPAVRKCCGSKNRIPNRYISRRRQHLKTKNFIMYFYSSSSCYKVKVVCRVEKWKRKLRERIWQIKKGKLKWERSLKVENVEVLQYTKICERGPHEKERDGYSEIEIALNITQKNWVKEPKDRLCLCLLHYAYI